MIVRAPGVLILGDFNIHTRFPLNGVCWKFVMTDNMMCVGSIILWFPTHNENHVVYSFSSDGQV